MRKNNILFILSINLMLLFAFPFITKAQTAVTSGFYYDPFDYDIATDAKLSVAGQTWWWATGNNTNTERNITGEPVLVTPGNLTYPGLDSYGNKITITGTSTMYYRRMSSHTDHCIYSSFIFRVTALPDETSPIGGDRFVSMGNNINNYGSIYLRRSTTSGKFNIGLSKLNNADITWLNKDLDININYFLVLGARHTGTVAGNGNYTGDSVVELWLNPTGSSNESTPDISTNAGTNLNDFKAVQWVVILNNTGKNAGLTMDIDELRSSTKAWSDVVPFAGGGTGNRTIVTDGSLNYPGINSSGNKVSFGGAGGGYYRELSGIPSDGTLYGSFILKVLSVPVLKDYFIYLGNEDDITTTVWLKPSETTGKFNIGIGKRQILPVSWYSSNLDLEKEYYVVFAYSKLEGDDNDVVKLWINPTDFANEPSPTMTANTGRDLDDLSKINRVVLDHGNAGVSNAALSVELDELNISSSWNSLVLPVKLESFSAEVKGNRSKITWVSHSEFQNDFFELEKSGDGVKFSLMDRIPGKGNNGRNEYVYDDLEPYMGINYYRLSQYDTDGKRAELGVRTVWFNLDSGSKLTVYPNPASSVIHVKSGEIFSSRVKIELVSLDGDVLFSNYFYKQTPHEEITVALSAKPSSGVYIVKIANDEGATATQKIIIQ